MLLAQALVLLPRVVPGHSDGRWSRSPRRRFFGVHIVLMSILVVCPAVAGDLPDWLWIGGVYDGADDDDLVAAAAETGPCGPVPAVLNACPPESGTGAFARHSAPPVVRAPPTG